MQLAVIYAGSLLFLRMEYANSSWARIIFGFAIQVTVSAFTEFILLIGTYLMTGVLYSIEIKYALPTGAYIVEILLIIEASELTKAATKAAKAMPLIPVGIKLCISQG